MCPIGRGFARRPPGRAPRYKTRARHKVKRAVLWEYIGHPASETTARRRVLYAIVLLRLGLGATFILTGWNAIIAASPEAFAARLGAPGRWGLQSSVGMDMALFLLGCTELLVGSFQVVGAFTRLTASTGLVLAGAYFALGQRTPSDVALYPVAMGGFGLLVVCGSPFLSVDRFLDKVEEEERDRAPVTLPQPAAIMPVAPRLGLAAGLLLLVWSAATRLDGTVPPALTAGLAVVLALLLVLGCATRVVGPLVSATIAVVATRGAGGPLVISTIAVGLALAVTGPGPVALHWPVRHRAMARAKGNAGENVV